jgi:hypothetical protein
LYKFKTLSSAKQPSATSLNACSHTSSANLNLGGSDADRAELSSARCTGAAQQGEQQQQQWKQEQQKQEDLFQAQQAAQTKLWAKQEKLNRLSAGFVLNQEHVASFEAQLTPSQKGALTKEVNERYKALTGLAQQADNPFEQYQVDDLKQKLRQQVLYERFVPVREIYHFGNQFLNGYTPQKMQAVRGYFDQVFEGGYSKSIPADKRAAILKPTFRRCGIKMRYFIHTLSYEYIDSRNPSPES